MTAENRWTVPRSIELPLVIAIALIAIIFRFAQFDQVPPGLHYDEAVDAKLAREIRSGAAPIYFEEGWGREPVYHYLVAFVLNFTPDPITALRFTSGVLGLIQLLAAYALFRSLFGVPTALIGAAWIAVLFWTVSTSRAGLRNITLTTLTTLTAWAFWRAFADARRKVQDTRGSHSLHPASCFLPGVLLGLTIYTYQPSRVVPLIYLVFVGFLVLRRRMLIRQNWRALGVFFGVALIIALPLGVFLVTHPQAETGRAFQTEPIRALLSGNFQPAIDTAVATLKMFTFDGAGDPQILYNISGRPIFIGLGSILFYLGLIVCAWRAKQPEYAFMLIWLAITLLPNMLTAPAPFFYRAIAAQTPVALLPAIGSIWLVDQFGRNAMRLAATRTRADAKDAKRRNMIAGALGLALAVGVLGQTAITTWRDYFDVWGRDADVRFQYSAALTDIAHAIDASPDTTPVAISSFFVEDADPIIFDQALNRRDVPVRWFDAREALIVAADATTQRLGVPSFTPLDPVLGAAFLNNSVPSVAAKDFKLYTLDAAQFRQKVEAWTCTACPVTFNGDITLIGVEYSIVDKTLIVQSAWRVEREGQPGSTAIFMHLIGADSQIAAQDDRLDVPRHTWRTGDEFVQVHRIPLSNLLSGAYPLELGIYNRADNVRWGAADRSGASLGDHVRAGLIEVSP